MPYVQFADPAGIVNGSNTVFTIAAYTPGSVRVMVNGFMSKRTDTIGGWEETDPEAGVITLNTAPESEDTVGPFFYADTVLAGPLTATLADGGAGGTITLVKGQDYRHGPITCLDSAGAPVNFTGATVHFAWKTTPIDAYGLLGELDSDTIGGIEISNPLSGVIDALVFTPGHTQDSPPGNYFDDLWLVTAGGKYVPLDMGGNKLLIKGRAWRLIP